MNIKENNFQTLRDLLNKLVSIESALEFIDRNKNNEVSAFYIKFKTGEQIEISGSLTNEGKELIFNQIVESKKITQNKILEKIELIMSSKTLIK